MLKCLVIEIYKVIIVVWIHKVTVAFSKYKAWAYMKLRQHYIMRVFDMEHIFRIKVQVLALFVSQVGISITIADDLAWIFNADGAVVRRQDNSCLFLGQEFKQVE